LGKGRGSGGNGGGETRKERSEEQLDFVKRKPPKLQVKNRRKEVLKGVFLSHLTISSSPGRPQQVLSYQCG